MDEGSNLNLIYADTMKKMGIDAGEHCIRNKKNSYTHARPIHGGDHLQEGRSDPHTLVDL